MTKTVVTRLKNLDIKEVSLVKRGANKKKFLITKSEEGLMDDLLEQILKGSLANEIAVDEMITGLLKDEKLEKEDEDKFRGSMKGIMRLLDGVKGNVSDSVKKKLMGELSKASGFDMSKETKKSDDTKPDNGASEPKEGNMDKEQVETLVKERVEKYDTVIKGLETANTTLAKQLKDERDIRLTKEFVEEATSYGYHGEEATKTGAVLKSAKEAMGEESFKSLQETIKKSGEAMKNADIFKEAGSSQAGDGKVGGEFEVKKTELKKSFPEYSDAQLEDRVLKDNPELYSKYLDENPDQGGY